MHFDGAMRNFVVLSGFCGWICANTSCLLFTSDGDFMHSFIETVGVDWSFRWVLRFRAVMWQ